jgi:hypothetical protein
MVMVKTLLYVEGDGSDQLVPIYGPHRMREDTPRNASGVADLRYRVRHAHLPRTDCPFANTPVCRTGQSERGRQRSCDAQHRYGIGATLALITNLRGRASDHRDRRTLIRYAKRRMSMRLRPLSDYLNVRSRRVDERVARQIAPFLYGSADGSQARALRAKRALEPTG